MSARQALRAAGRFAHKILTAGIEKDYPFARFGIYQQIEKHCQDVKFEGPVLSISHSQHLLPIMGANGLEIEEANYPEANILDLPHRDEKFGLVVSDQVFEHIQGLPSVAFAESLRVTRGGGWVLHATCFLTPYHGPGDYWRYSPEGLRELALTSGASEAYADGWGHPAHILISLMGWQWLPVPKSKWHPLRWLVEMNRPSYASVVWVLARKSFVGR
jgi:SAM-dependent methyltransferase